MSRRASGAGRASAFALAAVMLVVSSAALLSLSPKASAAPLVPGSDFTISSTISSSDSSPNHVALLYPGVTRYLWYRVTNPLSAPITVTHLSVANVTAPATCTTANLDLGDPTFTGSLVVPAHGSTDVPAPKPISLVNLPHTNQDACKNATFTFTYAGTAHYTDGTSTVLTASPSTTDFGKPVTFTATVTADNAATHGGSPGGSVTFYSCATPGCDPTAPLGTGTIGANGRATFRTSELPAGTIRIKAVYETSGTDFVGSTSDVLAQVVTSTVETALDLAAGPNPAPVGVPVTLTAMVNIPTGSVTRSGGSVPPAGAVTFFLVTPTGARTLLGTAVPDANGRANLRVSSLPPGKHFVYAVHEGTDSLAPSTSPVMQLSIVAPPVACTAKYTTSIVGTPGTPVIKGTEGNDFIYAVDGDFQISAGKGKDCVVVGDGRNRISDGSGTDVVIAGNGRNTITVIGSRNTVVVGDGDGNRIMVKGAKKGKKFIKPSGNRITIGDGAKNRVTLRRGSANQVTLGDGASNLVTVRGSSNRVTVGNGGKNRITVGKGTENRITVGKGKDNRVTTRAASKRSNTCSLPTPPRSWRGKPAGYYRDTIARCRVVTR